MAEQTTTAPAAPAARLRLAAGRAHHAFAEVLARRLGQAGLEVAARIEDPQPSDHDRAIAPGTLFVGDRAALAGPIAAALTAIRPIEADIVADPALGRDEMRLVLAGPEDAFARPVTVRCLDADAGGALASRLRGCGFDPVTVDTVPGDTRDEVIHAAAPLLARDAVAGAILAAGGVPCELEVGSGLDLDDGEIIAVLVTPAVQPLTRDLVIETDAAAELDDAVAVFRRRGFVHARGQVATDAFDQATLDPGRLEVSGAAGVLARLEAAAAEALGAPDPVGYPVRRVAPASATPIIRLPVAALRAGLLRPWAGGAPARFDVGIETDDPGAGRALAETLRAAGFRAITVRSADRIDGRGFEVASGSAAARNPDVVETASEALAQAVTARAEHRRAEGKVAAAERLVDWGFAAARTRTDSDGIVIHYPVRAAETGRLARELDDPGRCQVEIRAATAEAEAAAAVLRRLGYRRIAIDPDYARRPPELDLIEESGLPRVTLERLRDALGETFGAPRPFVRRTFRRGQARLRLSISDRSLTMPASSNRPPAAARATCLPASPVGASDAIVPAREAAGAPPFLAIDGDRVRIGQIDVSRNLAANPGAPPLPAGFTIDPKTAALLEDLALADALGEAGPRAAECVLITGETGVSKTAAAIAYAHFVNRPLAQANLSPQLDIMDILGSFTSPGGGTITWVDGLLPRALRSGGVLLLDELNTAPSALVERLNGVLDRSGRFDLAEHHGETVTAAPGFLAVATCNPATYDGRQAISHALRNRIVVATARRPDVEDHHAALRRAVFGETPAICLRGTVYAGGEVPPLHPALANDAGAASLMLRLAGFQAEIECAAASDGGDWSETGPVAFSRRQLLGAVALIDFLVARGATPEAACARAIARYYAGGLSESGRKVVADLAAAAGLWE